MQIVDYFRPYGLGGPFAQPSFCWPAYCLFFAFFYQTALVGTVLGLGTESRESERQAYSPRQTIDRDPIKASFQTEADVMMTQQMGARAAAV